MQQRQLGANGPKVSAIGLGCMGMSAFYGPADDATSIAVIHGALDRGLNFFDTADAYGRGANEELVGKALADRRDRAIIATKFAIVPDPNGPGGSGISGRPEHVRSACDASLRRLDIETIDLYYQHRVDKTVPIEDTIGAMADLVQQGKVRWLGMSEASPATLRRAHKVHPITALQTEYSLWTRDPEQGVLAACQELGITFVAYSPLGRGFLSGKLAPSSLASTDTRLGHPRFQGDNLAHNQALVARLETLAAARGCTPAQLALAWLLSRKPEVVPIPGTRKLSRLDENLAALDLTLTADELASIDRIAPPGAAAGERYPADRAAWIDR